MHRNTLAIALIAVITLFVPVAAGALSVNVAARAGGGIGLGSSSNSNISGSPRFALNTGAVVDLYAVSVGPLSLGLSAGAEYGYWNFHGENSSYLPSAFPPATPAGKQVTDSVYNYVNFPVAIIGHLKLSKLALTVRLGGFGGYFLSGKTNYTISGLPAGNGSGTTTLGSSTTVQWNWGLYFSAGPDFSLGPRLMLSPSIEYYLGLSDTSVNSSTNGTSKDTLSALTANIGLKYSLF